MWGKKVREFSNAGEVARTGNNLPTTPRAMNTAGRVFICQMIADECKEMASAPIGDIAEEVDAQIDIIYYILDNLAKYGIDADSVFDVVHNANMAKLIDGEVIIDKDPNSPRYGKILKPEGWQPPDIDSEIKRQSIIFDHSSQEEIEAYLQNESKANEGLEWVYSESHLTYMAIKNGKTIFRIPRSDSGAQCPDEEAVSFSYMVDTVEYPTLTLAVGACNGA